MTIIDGPHPGDSVITNEAGEFLFTGLPRDGRCTGASAAFYIFFLGQAPHVLWGYIAEAGTNGAARIPGAAIEIVDGANAGVSTTANSNGDYRIESLATSGAFSMRVSASGYVSQRFLMLPLTKNSQRPLAIARQ